MMKVFGGPMTEQEYWGACFPKSLGNPVMSSGGIGPVSNSVYWTEADLAYCKMSAQEQLDVMREKTEAFKKAGLTEDAPVAMKGF